MDTTSTTNQPPTPRQDQAMALTPEAQIYLQEAAKWAKFLSIVGFIFCLFILATAIIVGSSTVVLPAMVPHNISTPFNMAGGIFSALYILMDILYFFFPLYLYRFSSRINKSVVFKDATHLTRATESLKSFFKLWGIVTAIIICIFVLTLLVAIVFGIGTHMIHG